MQKTRSLASHASVDIHLPVPFADRPPIEAHPCPTRFRHNEAGHIFNNQCDSSVVGDAAPAFISSFRKLLCLSKECQWHRYNGFALLRCHRKTKTPRGGEAGGDPAHPFFSSGPRAVLRNRFLPLNGRRLLFFPVQPILQNPLHEEYRCALFSRGINVPSWRRLRPIYGMKAFHRSGMGSRFEVPRTSNFFPGLRGFCAERSSSIAPRARRGIATAGHMNLSSIVALSGADFACAPDSFMSRLDGIQVLQAGKVKDRGRMQFRRQRRGGFCEPPRLRMIMERI